MLIILMLAFEKLCFEEATATLYVRLGNLHVFDLGLRSMDYEVWIDGISIGGAQLEKYARLEKRGVSEA